MCACPSWYEVFGDFMASDEERREVEEGLRAQEREREQPQPLMVDETDSTPPLF